jgi:putative NIF3 family GTP cyclohydrolase 1 type 2
VAVCAGSGASVLRGVAADLYVTGEMSHHDVLDATHRGATVLLTDHANSERGFLGELQGRLDELLEARIQLKVAASDADPLSVV